MKMSVGVYRWPLVSIAIIAFCALLTTAVSANPEDSTTFVLDNVKALPGDDVTVQFSINAVHDFGGFNVLIYHAAQALSAVDMTDDGTRSEGVTQYTWQLTTNSPELTDGFAIYFPDSVLAGNGPVANLILNVDSQIPRGSLLALTLRDEIGFGGRRNEATSPDGLNIFHPDYNHGSILIPLEDFDIFPDHGDVNLNDISYEYGDFVYMLNQLQFGVEDWISEPEQAFQSDVNYDSLPWTIADILTAKDVAEGDLPAPPELNRTIDFEPGDSIWYTPYSGTPVSTLEIPIYMQNTHPAGGISFKLHYSLSELQFVSYSLDGSRLPAEWTTIVASERDDGLIFAAFPEFEVYQPPYDMSSGSGLIVTLQFAVGTPSSKFLDFHFERLQDHGQANGYAAPDSVNFVWSFASLQSVDKDMYFSFIIGDADNSGSVDIDDVVYLIAFVFSGGPAPVPYDSGDFNGDFFVDIDDITALIQYIFGG